MPSYKNLFIAKNVLICYKKPEEVKSFRYKCEQRNTDTN